jgi:hypothetical protein
VTSPVPQTPEPIDEQRAVADDLIRQVDGMSDDDIRAYIARALAAAVTAEREKAVAAVNEVQPKSWWGEYFTEGYRAGLRDSISRIREVSR